MTAEHAFERFDRDGPLVEGIRRAHTHRVPASLRVFGPRGFFARVTGTLVAQEGTFVDDVGSLRDGSSRFVVVDTDPGNPRIVPGRLGPGKLTLAF